MNITRENIDALNAVVTVNIEKEDYSDKVMKILKDYKKTANIPGFRKGHVPLGLVKKQFGKAVLVDEVNKLLQESLNKYLVEEKLDILGNPLPRMQEEFDWDAETFSFEFELGLAPEFNVDLQGNAITQYNIVADDKMIDGQIDNIRKQYGKLISQDEVTEESEVTGIFSNEEKEIENNATFSLDKIKGKRNLNKFVGVKVGDTLTLKTKGLFENEQDLVTFLKVAQEDAAELDIEVSFKINEANKREMAELDQELFDKLFGDGNVSSLEEAKAKIKEDAERQFVQQSDQRLLNDVTEGLIENTKFDLPAGFLKKWIQSAGEQELTPEQAEEEYTKSEKGLRYQLIQDKLVKDNEVKVEFEDLKEFAKQMIRVQMAQFGQLNPSDEELEGIAARILSNQDEVRRLTDQLLSQKLLELFKEKAKLETKEVTYENFVKEVYGDSE
ncbi:MAG: trigger factor [Bacteroidota bacterium]